MRFVYILLVSAFSFFSSSFSFAQCAYPVNMQFQWEIPYPLTSQCLTIQHDSTKPYLYVAGKERGLVIYDVSNIANPIQVDSVPVSLMNDMEVVNVEQSGNYVYLSLGNTYQNNSKPGIAIVDVSDPAHAVLKDHWYYDAVAGGGGIVKVAGDYAYFGGMRRGLFILNIADKSHITMSAHLELAKDWPNPTSPDSLKYNARGMAVRGDTVFLCYDAGGLRIIDVSNKAVPSEVGHYSNPAVYGKARAYNSIILDDTLAYIGADYCGMEILSIAHPGNIAQVGWWNPWGCETPANLWINSDGYINEMQYNKACRLMFLAGGTTDLSVVNVADPANPQLCATYGQASDTLATWGFSLYQNQIYLAYINNPFCFPFCSYWPGMKMLTWNNQCDLDVKEAEFTRGIYIYPNPANGVVLIDGIEEHSAFDVYDIIGRKMTISPFYEENKVHLSLQYFTPGVYIVKYKDHIARMMVK